MSRAMYMCLLPNLKGFALVKMLLLLLSICFVSSCSKDMRPNVLLVTMDTTRADHIGAYGNPWIHTPNLDRLTKQAYVYENCYTASNGTNPSHSSLFTSLPCRDHGIYDNTQQLPDKFVLLSEIFQQQGYNTSAIVSAFHLNPEISGFGQGFNQFIRCEQTEQTAGDTLTLLETNKTLLKSPFYIWVHLFDPHALYTPPHPYEKLFYDGDPTAAEEDTTKQIVLHEDLVEWFRPWIGATKDLSYLQRLYAGEISYMDQQIGRLFRLLQKKKLWDNTLIVMIADHGESLGEHEVYFNHATSHDHDVTIPLIFRTVNQSTRGIMIPQLVTNTDVAPTVLKALGILTESQFSSHLLPFTPHKHVLQKSRDLFCEEGYQLGAMIRRDDYKLIQKPKRKLLFDLNVDPLEINNLVKDKPDIAYVLGDTLNTWLSQRTENDYNPDARPDLIENMKALGYVH